MDHFSDFSRLKTCITYPLRMRVNFSTEVQSVDLLESETEKGRMKEGKPINQHMKNRHLAWKSLTINALPMSIKENSIKPKSKSFVNETVIWNKLSKSMMKCLASLASNSEIHLPLLGSQGCTTMPCMMTFQNTARADTCSYIVLPHVLLLTAVIKYLPGKFKLHQDDWI